jgi:hypothetical protein
VTLLSREQGRGLDFHCSDRAVEQTGGLHVVQTFLSEELSEEIQIRGRTARQKNKGSFELVLLAPDLDKFDITAEELALKEKGLHVQVEGCALPAAAAATAGGAAAGGAAAAAATAAAAAAVPAAAGTMYEFLHEKRALYLEQHVKGRQGAVQCAHRMHMQTLSFQRDLVTGGAAEWKRCLGFLGEHNVQKVPCRLLILTDATGSMKSSWERAQEGLCKFFERIYDISGGGGNIEIKFVAYRDYEHPRDMVLEASSWTSDPASLVRFVQDIKCRSGQGCDGPEAVEAGLSLANKEAEPPTQILLIGDAPPHDERKGQPIPAQGTHAENKTAGGLMEGGVLQTDYRLECAALAAKKIKVTALCVGGDAKFSYPRGAFAEIAKITGGECKDFDASDPDALVHVVCEAGLQDIGGDVMVEQYRTQYRR